MGIFLAIGKLILAAAFQYFLGKIFGPPTPEKPAPGKFEDVPTAQEGLGFTYVFGTAKFSMDVLWYGRPSFKSRKKGGYYHRLAVHGHLCESIDDITKIEVDGKTAWEGSVTASGEIEIVRPSHFGDKDFDGGITGMLRFAFGGAAEAVDTDLASWQDTPVPAYRGGVTVLLRSLSTVGYDGFSFGLQPVLRPWSFFGTRTTPKDSFEPALAAITNADTGWIDMNPAHVLRELIALNSGDDFDATEFGDTWATVAQDLFDEGLGVSLAERGGNITDELINRVLREINGVLYVDRTTGKTEISIQRASDSTASLVTFDDSNVVEWEEPEWPDPAEAPNQIKILFTDSSKGGDQASIIINNGARQASVDRVNRVELDYNDLTSRALASLAAMREISKLTAGPATGAVRVQGLQSSVNIGDLISVNLGHFPAAITARVTGIDGESSDDASVWVSYSENVFLVDDAPTFGEIYTPTDLTGAQVSDPRSVEELPYWFVQKYTGVSETLMIAGNSLLHVIASRATGLHKAFYAHVTNSGDTETYLNGDQFASPSAGVPEADSSGFADHCELSSAVTITDTTFNITGKSASFDPDLGYIAKIGEEYVRITGSTSTTLTVVRGILDTVPAVHSSGAGILLIEEPTFVVDQYFQDGDVLSVKIITETSADTLALGDAPADSLTFASRPIRPSPAANVRFDGAYEVDTIFSSGTLAWNDRSRLINVGPTPPDFYDATNYGPEAGTTYTIRATDYDENDAELGSRDLSTGETGNSYSLTSLGTLETGTITTDVTVVAEITRTGVNFESFQNFPITFIADTVLADTDGQAINDTDGNPITDTDG